MLKNGVDSIQIKMAVKNELYLNLKRHNFRSGEKANFGFSLEAFSFVVDLLCIVVLFFCNILNQQ